ncbi:MAG: polysaccharide biosynthesis tyrosine autokinase [Marinilabiliaceae bacterium]
MSNPESAYRHDNFATGQKQDMSKYVRQFLDKWYVFVGGLALALLGAALVNHLTHPVYQGSTTLLVQNENQPRLGEESFLPAFSFNMQDNIRNDIGILKSYTLTQETIESLNLDISYRTLPRWGYNWRANMLGRNVYEQSPIIVKKDKGTDPLKKIPFFVTILSPTHYRLEVEAETENNKIALTDTFKWGEPVKGPFFNFSVELRDKFSSTIDDDQSALYIKDYSFTFHDPEKLASDYRNALEVDFFFDDASILELRLKANHPGIATDFLNRHTRTFIESSLEEKNQMANATIAFIDQQVQGISDSLEEAESEFEQFRSQNRLINISSEGNMAMEKMEELVSQKSEIQRRSRYYEYLYDYIRNQNEFDNVIVPSTMGIDDPSLNDLVSRLTEAQSSYNRLLTTARENSPQVQQLQNEIESIRQALVKNVRNIVQATEIELEEINKQIEEVNQQVGKLPATEREYINIQRNFQLNDNLYTFLLRKRSEAAIALASNSPDHKVIDPAFERTTFRSSPRPTANFIIAGFLGLVLPALGLIIGEHLNTRIRPGFDPEQNSHLPVLGHIEHCRYKERLPVMAHPKSPLAESFRALRTHIDFMLGGKGLPATLAVSSSIAGEGKSFCSANLGTVLAMTNKRVLVVGMDMRKPRTHLEFNMQNEQGLSNFLIGKATFDEVVVPSEIPGLSVTPAGPAPPNPAELLQSEQMTEFLDTARQSFDVIILDTPPMALVTDALLITSRIDLNLFVLRQKYSRKQALRFINHLHHSGRTGKTGLVINDVRLPGPYSAGNGYGYGYAYSHYKKSGYYEED